VFSEYSGAYSQLAFAGRKENVLVEGDLQMAKHNLAKQLAALSASHPGHVSRKLLLALP